VGNGKRIERQCSPDRAVAGDRISDREHGPEQFGDGAAMPIRAPRLDAITSPSAFPVSDQLGPQHNCCLTIRHPDAEPIRCGSQQVIADGSGKHISGRTLPATIDRRSIAKRGGSMRSYVRYLDDGATMR
jgi:hypothetical protein